MQPSASAVCPHAPPEIWPAFSTIRLRDRVPAPQPAEHADHAVHALYSHFSVSCSRRRVASGSSSSSPSCRPGPAVPRIDTAPRTAALRSANRTVYRIRTGPTAPAGSVFAATFPVPASGLVSQTYRTNGRRPPAVSFMFGALLQKSSRSSFGLLPRKCARPVWKTASHSLRAASSRSLASPTPPARPPATKLPPGNAAPEGSATKYARTASRAPTVTVPWTVLHWWFQDPNGLQTKSTPALGASSSIRASRPRCLARTAATAGAGTGTSTAAPRISTSASARASSANTWNSIRRVCRRCEPSSLTMTVYPNASSKYQSPPAGRSGVYSSRYAPPS